MNIHILLITLGAILVILVEIAILTLLSYIRAKKNKPYHYRDGMVYKEKEGKLIGTRTEVMTDPKTGKQFFGKTIYEK